MKKVKLSIPKPCHEDWEQMTPTERGRFCAACEKVVTDYTRWSQTELTEQIKKGNLGCGRFRPSQMRQIYHLSPEERRWRRAAPLLFPLLLGGASLTAQTTTFPVKIEQTQRNDTNTSSDKLGTIKITGNVKDENGEGLIGATIVVEGTIIGAVTDIDGSYSIHIPENYARDTSKIIVSYTGYSTMMRTIPATPETSMDFKLEEASWLAGEIIIVRNTLVRELRWWWKDRHRRKQKRLERREVRLEKKTIQKTATPMDWDERDVLSITDPEVEQMELFKGLTVSPNPFEHQLNIRFVYYREEEIQLYFRNSSGQLISSRSYHTHIGENTITWRLNTDNFVAGVYYLQITNPRGEQQNELLLFQGR